MPAVERARAATLDLYALMASYSVRDVLELRVLRGCPADLRQARVAWLAEMTTVAAELAHAEGVRNAGALTEADKVRLVQRTYDLVLSPAEAIRPQAGTPQGRPH